MPQVRPCVLHGDLWSGNIGSVDGEPSIFDPAVYYGHSEADFGMSWCADAVSKKMPYAASPTTAAGLHAVTSNTAGC